MNLNSAIRLFIGLGLIFSMTAVYFGSESISKVEHPIPNQITSETKNPHMGMGSLAAGIIAAACFLSAGNLIKQGSRQ